MSTRGRCHAAPEPTTRRRGRTRSVNRPCRPSPVHRLIRPISARSSVRVEGSVVGEVIGNRGVGGPGGSRPKPRSGRARRVAGAMPLRRKPRPPWREDACEARAPSSEDQATAERGTRSACHRDGLCSPGSKCSRGCQQKGQPCINPRDRLTTSQGLLKAPQQRPRLRDLRHFPGRQEAFERRGENG
jgi:hypothetical protein